MFTTGVIALWLAFGDPATDTRGQVVADLEHATSTLGDVPPSASVQMLEQAITAASQQPGTLLDDQSVGDQLLRARAALVWAYLASDDHDRAVSAMDELIRVAAGRPLPSGFGPDVEKLYGERFVVVSRAGKASLEVICKAPCEVLVNERRVGDWSGANESLPLGTYRVWVLALDDDVDPKYHEVSLNSQSDRSELIFGARPVVIPPVVLQPDLPAKAAETRKSGPDLRKQNRRKKIAGGILLGLGLSVSPVAFVNLGYFIVATNSDSLFAPLAQLYYGGITAVGFVATFSLVVPGAIVLNSIKQDGLVKVRLGTPTLVGSGHSLSASWSLHF